MRSSNEYTIRMPGNYGKGPTKGRGENRIEHMANR